MRAFLAAAIVLTCAAGAMVESDYFQAPKPQYSSRGMSVCRLHTEIFSKMRLAQACR